MKHSFTFIKIGVLALLLVFANAVQSAEETDYSFKVSTLSYNYGAWYQDGVTWTTNYVPLLGYMSGGGATQSTTAFHLSNIASITIKYSSCKTYGSDSGTRLRINGLNSSGTQLAQYKNLESESGTLTFALADGTNSQNFVTVVNCFLMNNTGITIDNAYYTLTDGTTIPVMYATNSTYVADVNDYVVPSSDKPVTIFICSNYQGMQLYKGNSDSNTAATLSAGSTNLYNFELAEANSNLCFQTNTSDLSTNTTRYTLSTASFYQSVTASSDADINYLSIRAEDSNLSGDIGSYDYVTINSITVYENYGGDLTLNEDETNTFNDGYVYNTTINRTLTADNWAGIVLPYDLTSDEVTTYFGTNAKVALFKSATVVSDDVTFAFETTTDDIPAGTPFLVKPSESITSLPTKAYATLEETISSTASNGYTFTGTYDGSTALSAGDIYIASGNLFKTVSSSTTGTPTIKGFRAYFKSSSSPAKALNFSVDGITTDIQNIETDTTTIGNQKVYNLNGQYVGNSLEGLKSGVYISNGRKVIIK